MKEQLKGWNCAEGEELLLVLSRLMNEILSEMILHVFAD
jgi:hypothetical protein